MSSAVGPKYGDFGPEQLGAFEPDQGQFGMGVL